MDSVDAVGIVYFGAYWNWYESAFEGLIATASGSSWRDILSSRLAMPVVHAEIDYREPLRLSEEVTVEIRVVELGSSSVHFRAEFRNERGDVVAEARTVNVVVAGDGMNQADLPPWLVAAVEEEDDQ